MRHAHALYHSRGMQMNQRANGTPTDGPPCVCRAVIRRHTCRDGADEGTSRTCCLPASGHVRVSGGAVGLYGSCTAGGEDDIPQDKLRPILVLRTTITLLEVWHQALNRARPQHARSLELRSAIRLSRLWQRRSGATLGGDGRPTGTECLYRTHGIVPLQRHSETAVR